jgi:hypothetical protein
MAERCIPEGGVTHCDSRMAHVCTCMNAAPSRFPAGSQLTAAGASSWCSFFYQLLVPLRKRFDEIFALAGMQWQVRGSCDSTVSCELVTGRSGQRPRSRRRIFIRQPCSCAGPLFGAGACLEVTLVRQRRASAIWYRTRQGFRWSCWTVVLGTRLGGVELVGVRCRFLANSSRLCLRCVLSSVCAGSP